MLVSRRDSCLRSIFICMQIGGGGKRIDLNEASRANWLRRDWDSSTRPLGAGCHTVESGVQFVYSEHSKTRPTSRPAGRPTAEGTGNAEALAGSIEAQIISLISHKSPALAMYVRPFPMIVCGRRWVAAVRREKRAL